ncbi:MAG: SGNH/GDSL hydrolase family protein [Thermoanaerobaculia bacterium]|nr:SGNH/GDSL hydrolase family protein [Thermoanaerobaculia bacterium]
MSTLEASTLTPTSESSTPTEGPDGPRFYQRYVAIGDSSTEGLDDPDGQGGYRGWADRLAGCLAGVNGGSILYANLGIRGRKTRAILDEQLEPALAMRPDLVTVFAGTNDVVSKHCDLDGVVRDLSTLHRTLVATGATVLSFTLPNLTPVLPAAKRLAPKVDALNAALREITREAGSVLVDFAAHPVASDARLWSEDRLHANAQGHQRIADALAHALDLPGTDPSWQDPLPDRLPLNWGRRVGNDLVWIQRYLLPWLWRHAWGRSSGDGITAKRPDLAPLTVSRAEAPSAAARNQVHSA